MSPTWVGNRDRISWAVTCSLPGPALVGSWHQEPEPGIEPRFSRVGGGNPNRHLSCPSGPSIWISKAVQIREGGIHAKEGILVSRSESSLETGRGFEEEIDMTESELSLLLPTPASTLYTLLSVLP